METAYIEVQGQHGLAMPWEEVIVMPVGDVQLGGGGVDLERFKRTIAWGLEHNAMFIGMGDYVDVASPSNRQTLKSAKLYDSIHSALNEAAEDMQNRFLKLVKGTEGRWLGLLEGHHYFDYEDGTTTDTRIAKALGAPFLGTCAFVRLSFKHPGGESSAACTIWCHHGSGNGVVAHSPLNKLYHVMHTFEADIYIIGHQTKKPAVKVPRLYMTSRPPYSIASKDKILAGTGGYSLGYEWQSKTPNGAKAEGSYVEKGMMTPVSLGGITIRIKPTMKGKKAHNAGLEMSVEL
ncbi:MAG: hypothetical protein JW384_03417 [Nitrosomonadaceae bacterium]|nr:hypothetical protein [Nitrosomonadaceae bacterium]